MDTKFSKLVFYLALFCAVSAVTFGKVYDVIGPSENVATLEIHGDNRGLLPYHYYGDPFQTRGRKVIEASWGERFSLVIRNNSHERIGLVISIDGRNIVSGKKSYNRPDESMYVLMPMESADFSGWRSSEHRVQRFYFTDGSDAYASRLGDSSQLGWIKVAVFREKRSYIRHDYDAPKRFSGDSQLSESKARREKYSPSSAGTGYGEGSYSPVERTEFNPESFAVQLETVKYEFPRIHREYDRNEFAPRPPR